MSAIKTLFGVVVLVGIAGFLYVWINTDPDAAPPPGAPQTWNAPLTIEMPGSGASSSRVLGASGLSTAPPFAATAPASSPAAAISLPASPAPSLFAPPSGVAAPSAALSNPPPISSGAPTPGASSLALSAPKSPLASPSLAGSVSVPSVPLGATGSPPATQPMAAVAPPAAPKQDAVLPSDAKRADLAQPDRPAVTLVSASASSSEFDSFMRGVQDALAEDRLAQAHLRLSMRYRDPRLSPQEARRVQELLDQLAGTVIYSQRSLVDPPYRVRPGDTLETIATQCNVPAAFLVKVNDLRDSADLKPGRELKVIRGPFDAVVRLESHELTLMLGGRYAGRFAVGIGKDSPIQEGSYTVRSKTVQPAYYAPDNRVVEPGNPQNPLGQYLIGLDQQLSIHGTNNPSQIGQNGGQGCISLGDRDLEDLYTILSVGSRVVIQR